MPVLLKIIKEIRYEDQVLVRDVHYDYIKSLIQNNFYHPFTQKITDDNIIILPRASDGYVPIGIFLNFILNNVWLFIYMEKRRFKDKSPQTLLSKIPRLHIDTSFGGDILWESEGFLTKKALYKIFGPEILYKNDNKI